MTNPNEMATPDTFPDTYEGTILQALERYFERIPVRTEEEEWLLAWVKTLHRYDDDTLLPTNQ